jgi:hypothetical protein
VHLAMTSSQVTFRVRIYNPTTPVQIRQCTAVFWAPEPQESRECWCTGLLHQACTWEGRDSQSAKCTEENKTVADLAREEGYLLDWVSRPAPLICHARLTRRSDHGLRRCSIGRDGISLDRLAREMSAKCDLVVAHLSKSILER